MALLHYSQTHFLRDLRLLDFEYPNIYQTLDFTIPNITKNTRIFGGSKWEKQEIDLLEISLENRKYFCICLFFMVCIDENMYAHFKDEYEPFNRFTNYPKFGWLGSKIHLEKPCYLLIAPKDVNIESIPELEIKDFIHQQFTKSSQFLGNITPIAFFTAMINDEHFNCDSPVFQKILHSIKSELDIN